MNPSKTLTTLSLEPCSKELVDERCELLESLGALSVTFFDNQDDGIFEPQIGTTPLWPTVIIEALFQSYEEALLVLEACKTYSISASIQAVPEQDWVRVCMDRFKPTRFGKKLWVCPTWHTPPAPADINIFLDPGLAFGTGTHPTTALCLDWLEQQTLNNQEVIDYGCGSGILALAALKLGAAHAYAVDIDEQAWDVTKSNAELNQINLDILTIGAPEILDGPADLLLANILLQPLLALKERFKHLLKPNGTLVLSGIFAEQVDSILDIYQDGFQHQATHTLDDWSLVIFSNKGS